jgi:hypothetical protein
MSSRKLRPEPATPNETATAVIISLKRPETKKIIPIIVGKEFSPLCMSRRCRVEKRKPEPVTLRGYRPNLKITANPKKILYRAVLLSASLPKCSLLLGRGAGVDGSPISLYVFVAASYRKPGGAGGAGGVIGWVVGGP